MTPPATANNIDVKKFFLASVTVKQAGSKSGKISVTNNSSFDYTLKHNGRVWQLPALQTVIIPLFGKEPLFSVENMIHVDEKHPVVELKINK